MGRVGLNLSQAKTALQLRFWASQDNAVTTGPLCKRWVLAAPLLAGVKTLLTIHAQRFDVETYAQKKFSCLGYLFLWIPQN